MTVSELNRAIAGLLERSVPPIAVAGEISNFTRAASGHWYFTLKDPGAQVRAVMFKGRALAVDFLPREGDRVEVRALAGLYQARGEFQLNVEAMRRAGAGDLYQRFLQTRDKLRREGLIDEARRRTLPQHPATIGVVTSPTAAALRDVLSTLARRAPQVPVIVYPTLVQGAEAPASILAALERAAARAECDVLLVVRGGGAIEDLWAFNDEAVARAIAASPVPVVSGVGHETDFTIADFVADHRAPTPTAAAIAATTDRAESLGRVQVLARRLSLDWRRGGEAREQRLDTAARLLRSPAAYLRARAGALDLLRLRMRTAAGAAFATPLQRVARLSDRLGGPDLGVANERVRTLAQRLAHSADVRARAGDERLAALAHKLELVSPQAVLDRGYAIVRLEGGPLLRDAAEATAGDRLEVRLARGSLRASVEQALIPEPTGDGV